MARTAHTAATAHALGEDLILIDILQRHLLQIAAFSELAGSDATVGAAVRRYATEAAWIWHNTPVMEARQAIERLHYGVAEIARCYGLQATWDTAARARAEWLQRRCLGWPL